MSTLRSVVNRLIIFLISIFLFGCVFINVGRVKANFVEEFNGDYSIPSSWLVDRSGTVSFDSNSIKLTGYSAYSFPYIRTNPGAIVDSFNGLEVRFRYPTVGGFGDGFAFTDMNPPLNTVMYYPSTFSTYSIFYVWQNNLSPYLHFVSFLCPVNSNGCVDGTPTVYFQTTKTDNDWHVMKVQRINNHYVVYLDDSLKLVTRDNVRKINNFWLGHPEITTTPNSWSSIDVDYLHVDLENFPYYSQKDPAWKDVEYDNASEWAGTERDNIGRWGCALTSVAMILKNYGVKDDSNGDITPDELNLWLSNQDDGYIGQGWLNWLAVTRYVRKQYEAGHADTKLEYSRASGLPSTLPSIVNEGGHFVVAYASESASFSINDPNNESRSTKLKSETFLTNNTFTTTETDLSYMLFVKNPNLTYVLKNSLGETIPFNWIQEQINDSEGGAPSGIVTTALVPKPNGGRYELRVTSTTDSEPIELYLYDVQGRVKKVSPSVGSGETIFDLAFNKTDSSTSNLSQRDVEKPSPPVMLGFANPNIACGGYTNSKYVTIDWSDSTDNVGVNGYDYQVDYPLASGTGRGVWNTTFANSQYRGSLNEGIHYLKVRAYDAAGNKSDWSNVCAITYDSIKPILSSKTEFTGWYNSAQIAYFHYTDTNLSDDYSDPSCVINTEGQDQSCSVTPNVCDKAGNCNTTTQISNSANIDLTAPKTPKMIVAFGWWNQIFAHWQKMSDATSYEVWVGTKKNNLQWLGTTTNTSWWSNWTKPGIYYVGVRAIDRAGNASAISPIWKVVVLKKPIFWYR